MTVRFLALRVVCAQSAASVLALAAMFLCPIARGADDAAPAAGEKMSDVWSRTLPVADPPDAKFGEWHFWVQEGWLMAERRYGEDDIEWKIVLAKVVGDEPPEIVVQRMPQGARVVRRDAKGVETPAAAPIGPMPGSLRMSYRAGRYFIRDDFGSFRCFREAKAENKWPQLATPLADPNAKAGGVGTARLDARVSNSWITISAGPRRTKDGVQADCLIRLVHQDLRAQIGGLKATGRPTTSRISFGEWFVVDDGDLIVAEKLDAWALAGALETQARLNPALAAQLAMEKLSASPLPELSGDVWLNAEKPPTWESLRGKPVLLVLLDLTQPSFLPLVPPLLGFREMYSKQGLAVIGVHANHPRDEVKKKLAEERITFPVLIDDGKTAERYGIGFSACILIDRAGKVVSVYKDSLAPPAEIEKLLPVSRLP